LQTVTDLNSYFVNIDTSPSTTLAH